MYCNNCGTKLTEGAKFCDECGARIVPPAAPSAPVKEDGRVGGNPSAGTPEPPAAPADRQAAPVYGAAQPGYPQPQPGYPQPQPGYPQPQPGYPQPQPGYSQPQPGYSQPQPGYPQPGYPMAGQTVPGAKPKKKRLWLIALAALPALALLTGVLLFVFLKLRYEEPPLPPLTEPAVTEVTPSDAAGPAETKAQEPAETEPEAQDPTEGEKPAGDIVPTARTDSELSAAQVPQTLDRLLGVWNTDDDAQFLFIKKMEGGLYYLTAGYWYSEADLIGYLRTPVKGDPNGKITLTLYFEGIDSEFYPYPPLDDPISFDLSRIADGVLTWSFGGESQTVTFAAATMEEAIPPVN